MRWLLALWLVLAAAAVQADERILDYHARIDIQTDGSFLLTETIRVRAEGRQIKRGIYRDFPLRYRGGLLNLRQLDATVLGVERDGRSEPWHQVLGGQRIRIYAGRADRFLKPGEYTYTFRYRIERALGWYDDHDELYWNVTGNDWAFPIDRASALVILPEGVPWDGVRAEGYTGPFGARGQDYYFKEIRATGAGPGVKFETTRPLHKGEGFTIVVSWPPGYVWAPTAMQKLGWILGDDRALAHGLAGLALLLGYYLAIWMRSGRDPLPGVIRTLYAPPEGFSPASLRYIRRMGYDHKTFATALVNLAVKGFLKIQNEQGALGLGGQWVVEKTGKTVPMAAGEAALARELFSGAQKVRLGRSEQRRIQQAMKAHREALRRDYEKRYFVTNRWFWAAGFLGSVLVLAWVILHMEAGERRGTAAFLTVWLTFWTLGVVMLVGKALRQWREARATGAGGVFIAVVTTLFAVPFVGGEFMGAYFLLTEAGLGYVLVLCAVLVVNGLFYHLLKAPTRAGRKLLDQVEGFRRYLTVAEAEDAKDRGRWEDLGLFERYLPYAMALDVEQAWAERFARAIERAQRSGGDGYHPVWYSGGGPSTSSAASFGASLAAGLSAALATASSSGSSGSGGSGGGGGGGGGGGW